MTHLHELKNDSISNDSISKVKHVTLGDGDGLPDDGPALLGRDGGLGKGGLQGLTSLHFTLISVKEEEAIASPRLS